MRTDIGVVEIDGKRCILYERSEPNEVQSDCTDHKSMPRRTWKACCAASAALFGQLSLSAFALSASLSVYCSWLVYRMNIYDPHCCVKECSHKNIPLVSIRKKDIPFYGETSTFEKEKRELALL